MLTTSAPAHTVPCANAWCHAHVDARRAALGRIGAQNFSLCFACNDANLVLTPAARALSPEYETAHFNAVSAADDRASIRRGSRGEVSR